MVVGDPIYFEDLLVSKDDIPDASRGTLYDAVSTRIGRRLQELKVQADKLALEQQFELQQYHMREGKHGYGVWQQVDWEAFGMENVMPSSESDGDSSQVSKQILPNQPKEESVEQPVKRNFYDRTIRMGFSYDGGIMSRVRYYVNPAELMGFAARGLFMNGQLLDEGGLNIQETRPGKVWKKFVNNRLSEEGHFSIQEALPVKVWRQFLSDEVRFSIQEAGPFRAWKQFVEGRVLNIGSSV